MMVLNGWTSSRMVLFVVFLKGVGENLDKIAKSQKEMGYQFQMEYPLFFFWDPLAKQVVI